MGAFNKFLNYALLTVFVVFIGAVFFLGVFGGNTKPEMSQAVPYEIISISDSNAFNRSCVYMEIAIPNYRQCTPEQYAQTAMKAAWDSLEKLNNRYPEKDFKVISVRAFANTNTMIAKAIFAKDKNGWNGKTDSEWEVETLEGKLPPLESFQTAELWWVMRDDYQIPNPAIEGDTMTDEDALREAIAEKLHIPFDKVWLPAVTTSEYFKQ